MCPPAYWYCCELLGMGLKEGTVLGYSTPREFVVADPSPGALHTPRLVPVTHEGRTLQ